MADQDQALVLRKADGTFAPGHGGTVAKNYRHKITNAIREEFMKMAEEHGDKVNPLCVLARVLLRDDVPPHVTVAAAKALGEFLIPRQFSMDGGANEGISEERIAQTRSLFAQLFISESQVVHK